MLVDEAWSRTGDEPFVALTTFRVSGEPVPTPVWVARDGEALIVTTPHDSWKVKRLSRDPAVELRACDRRGRVKPDAAAVTGVAEVVAESAAVERHHGTLRAKYPVEFRIVMAIERLLKRGPRKRVILRITQRGS